MSDTPLPSSFDGNSDFYEENRWQKFSRRLKEEPLIPLGCVLTCWALFGASRSIRAGDHNRTNRMFRARIYAQGFTLVAMVAGSMYWETDRQKRKEFEGVLAEQKAKEKNEAWIRELEARDRENKEFAAARDARRKGSQLANREEDVKTTVAKTISSEVAKSMIDDSERRRGILEMVADSVHGKK